jgi:hypothetical protein
MNTWSRENFGSINREIRDLKKKLGRLQNGNYSRNKQEIQCVSARLDEILHREEIMWRQRLRIRWLKEGDQNTKFFHRKASGRAKKNKIKKLRKKDGTVTTDETEFRELANNFLQSFIPRIPLLISLHSWA